MATSAISYIKNKVDKLTFQTPMKILHMFGVSETYRKHSKADDTRAFEQCCLGTFSLRMGNIFIWILFIGRGLCVSPGCPLMTIMPKVAPCIISLRFKYIYQLFSFTSFTEFSAVFCWAQTDPKLNQHFCLNSLKLTFNIFGKMSKSKN